MTEINSEKRYEVDFIRKTLEWSRVPSKENHITGAIVEIWWERRNASPFQKQATPDEVRAKYSPRRQAHSAGRTRPYTCLERHCTICAVKKPIEVYHTHRGHYKYSTERTLWRMSLTWIFSFSKAFDLTNTLVRSQTIRGDINYRSLTIPMRHIIT